MNIFSVLGPHLPDTWKVNHKVGTDPHEHGVELGDAKAKTVVAVPPGIIWTFTENEAENTVRLTLLDQHGHVKIEVGGKEETSHPGAKGGTGNMDGASLIIKCTYKIEDVTHEYRFEGKLVSLPVG